jgi:glyoxalase family protein
VGQALQTTFRIPENSIGFWTHRFVEKSVMHTAPERRFGEPALSFTDPDGMSLALVGVAGAESETAWESPGISVECAIRGFHGVTLMVDDGAPTAAVLRGVLGFRSAGEDGSLARFQSTEVIGGLVDIRAAKGFLPGRQGRGSVHHIAFRAPDDTTQAAMAQKLVKEFGLHPTQQLDRKYFRSVYFREPGGILFEIATDAPGFAVDEPVETLGHDLKLPALLEPQRKEIEAVLPELNTAESSGS